MKRIIFTIHVDIDDENLDNPAAFDEDGNQQDSRDKSAFTKNQMKKYAYDIVHTQQAYADLIGVDYVLYGDDENYQYFVSSFKERYTEISEYDIINFYKHHVMKKLAREYDEICYIDFDVIPNTNDNIFDQFDLSTGFACAHSNEDALWGKIVNAQDYNTCIRNPASKYWNCHAMLLEHEAAPDTDVFNTGIMVASAEMIKKLDYFGAFSETLDLMTELKTTEDSLYPHTIQRVFGYDNETLFAFKRVINDVPIHYIPREWHSLVINNESPDKNAFMWHVINKKFEGIFK